MYDECRHGSVFLFVHCGKVVWLWLLLERFNGIYWIHVDALFVGLYLEGSPDSLTDLVLLYRFKRLD
jgi:hypothetical protein